MLYEKYKKEKVTDIEVDFFTHMENLSKKFRENDKWKLIAIGIASINVSICDACSSIGSSLMLKF